MNVDRTPFDPEDVPSPCFVIDLDLIERNLKLLAGIRERSGCKILLALKGFASPEIAPLVEQYLDGTCASGSHEARLGAEFFRGETHVYAPAFSEQDIAEVVHWADHVVFNSLALWQRFGAQVLAAGEEQGREIRCGLRINPEYSEAPVPLYDPAAPGSRFGVKAADLEGHDLSGITGFHFHTLCEQNSPALEATLRVVRDKFGPWLPQLEWMNFGGGHWINQAGYDVPLLERLITDWREAFGHEVYLEPGEAAASQAGYLVATVLDLIDNDGPIAIVDTSATAHLADVLEMPFTPDLIGASKDPDEHPYRYRIGGLTCLAGDWLGRYSFPAPLEIGQRIVFWDMAHYTIVKTTHFNGIKHPAIATWSQADGLKMVREFGFDDYRKRIG